MSKQTPKNQALRRIGLATKNANFDSTCKVCGEAIRGKAPKSAVVAVKNRFGGSRKNVWIHSDCVQIHLDADPETDVVIQDNLFDREKILFLGTDGDTPPPSEKKKPTPPPSEKKAEPKVPKKKPAPTFSVGEKTPEGGVLAGLIAPHLIEMVSEHVDASISNGLSQLAIPRPLVIKPIGDTPEVEVGLSHPAFDHLLEMGQIRTNSLAVGPAGSGKTFAAKQVFDTLSALPKEVGGFATPETVRFTIVSCHNEMMPSDIVGPMIPNVSDGSENHRVTEAVKTYRDGGVLVFDEFDRLMGGTAVAANMALANETWSMPDGTVINRSPDLFILCTANTLGQGKGRGPYSAAEVLDGATLNRFAGGILHWGYDMAFERQLISDDEITNFFHEVRRKATEANLVGRIISPRHMQTAWKQKHILKWSMEKIRQVSLADWNEKDLRTIGYDKTFIDGTISNGGAA